MVSDIEKQIEMCKRDIEYCRLYNLDLLEKSLLNHLDYLEALQNRKKLIT